MLIPISKFIWSTIKHKYYVFQAGLKIDCPLWQLITHDLDKFRPTQLYRYSKHCFGDGKDPLGFAYYWLQHQKQRHHWEYWVQITGHHRSNVDFQGYRPLPIPRKYLLEMVADILGASKSYHGEFPKSLDSWTWFTVNFPKMQLHPDSRIEVQKIIHKYFNIFPS